MWMFEWAGWVIEVMALAFIVVLGLMAALVVVLFIIDRLQTEDAIRRNYPVL